MTRLTRRSLLGGIGAVLAAPAIVRAASLMPVKAPPVEGFQFSGFSSSLPLDQAASLVFDGKGTIWVEAGGKIYRYPSSGGPVEEVVLTSRWLDANDITAQYLYRA